MHKVLKVGDIVTLQRFAFMSKEGRTGLSDWENDEIFGRPASFKITKEWKDHECGQRGWAVPDPKDEELINYFKKNVMEGQPNPKIKSKNHWLDKPGFIVYWSSNDISSIEEYV